MRDTQREAETQRKKQAPCREPDVGLDPRTPGSCPEVKADAQPLSLPGAPRRMPLRKVVPNCPGRWGGGALNTWLGFRFLP